MYSLESYFHLSVPPTFSDNFSLSVRVRWGLGVSYLYCCGPDKIFPPTPSSSCMQPPPPGYAPTPAQLAAQQGQTVVMKRERRDIIGGGI